jgi:CRP-like cAMP-binding protein
MIPIMSKDLNDLLAPLAARTCNFADGMYLFRQGDPVRALHRIVEGEVHLVRLQPGGGWLVLQRARANSVLAEASLFSERYHCDALAVAPTRTRAIGKAAMRAALESDPRFAADWARYLAHEVQKARLRAEILSLRTVAERLDAWIASNDGRAPVKGEWKTVASEIGTSAEALYREAARRRLRTSPR